nr:PREDICTED: cathepsin K-like [Bemisia tabaci]
MSAEEQFEAFKKAYKKKYASTTEELRRFDIFKQNLIVIDKLMATKRGNVVFGVGPFTDYTNVTPSMVNYKKCHRQSSESNIKPRWPTTSWEKTILETELRFCCQEWMDEMGIVKLNPVPNENQQLQPRMLNAFSKMTLSRKSSSRSSSRSSNRGDRSNRGSRSPSPAPSERSSRASERSTRSSRGQSVPPSWSPGPFVRKIVGRDPQGGPTLDWRVPAAFYPPTESQNQHGRKCGACWAFAVLGAVEILLPRVQGYITSLSKQALIDCVVTNDGCNGGDMRDAIVYMIKIGVPSAVSYPYMARNGRCKSFIGPYMKLNYYTDVPGSNQLAEHLEHSPLPSILYAPLELQHYVSGLYDSPGCTNEVSKINHAGVIVGQYTDAWIVRFSVESDWGLQGHILIAKGRCGLGLQSFEINSPFTILRRS